MHFSWFDFLNSKDISNFGIYYLVGEDRFIHQQILQKLADKFVPQLRDFNFHKFHISKDFKLDSLSSLVFELPCFAEHRLVYISDLEKLSSLQAEKLIALLKEIPKESILVFSNYKEDKKSVCDAIKELDKYLQKKGCLIKCSLTADNIPNYIKTYLKQNNLAIQADALHLFTQKTGQSLGLLKQDLDKLISHNKPGSVVSKADIENLIFNSHSVKVFNLSDAISEKNTKSALNTVEDLLTEGLDPFQILGFLAAYFKRILLIKTLLSESLNTAQIAKKLNRKEDFYLKKCLRAANEISSNQLKKNLRLLLRTDLVLKSNRDYNLIMDLLVYQLCKN